MERKGGEGREERGGKGGWKGEGATGEESGKGEGATGEALGLLHEVVSASEAEGENTLEDAPAAAGAAAGPMGRKAW